MFREPKEKRSIEFTIDELEALYRSLYYCYSVQERQQKKTITQKLYLKSMKESGRAIENKLEAMYSAQRKKGKLSLLLENYFVIHASLLFCPADPAFFQAAIDKIDQLVKSNDHLIEPERN